MAAVIDYATVQHQQIPIDHLVKTAFGVMRERHAVFLVVTDHAGRTGVGESWVNFPAWGPWERVAAYECALIPYLKAKEVDDIPAFVAQMYRSFRGPAQQSGTIGPLLQAICAVELALWDLEAQVRSLPLSQVLFESPHDRVRVYASGINSPIPWDLVDEHLDNGVTLFKLKLGFDDIQDRHNLKQLRDHLGDRADLAVDVNRAWTLEKAVSWLDTLADNGVRWIEEPLRPEEEEQLAELASLSAVPISAGENTLLPPDCDTGRVVETPAAILQPDLTKYAPLHVALRLLRAGERKGKRVIPHFLGSAPGQAASLQFAAGCPDGLVEWAINRNPLRTDLTETPFCIEDGAIEIPRRPGLGWRLKE